MILHIFYMMRLVSMRTCFFIRGQYVTHMKFRAKPGNFISLSYIGQSDLHITYYGLPHVWYTPGGCRICYAISMKSNCTLSGSC